MKARKPKKEHCDRCGGDWPGYGLYATRCTTCSAYLCGSCLKVHGVLRDQQQTWAQVRSLGKAAFAHMAGKNA